MGMDLFKLGGWKRKSNRNGLASTGTFDPNRQKGGVITVPVYREHLKDLYQQRLVQDSKQIMQEAFQGDPDVSAAVNAYLTTANVEPLMFVRTEDGEIDNEGQQVLAALLRRLTIPFDYALGFQLKPSLATICADMRYMLLLRGGIANELVYDRTYAPSDIRTVDLGSIRWVEDKPGVYKPRQFTAGSTEGIDLDYPTFFVSFYRRDPTKIYTTSPFVSAINTITARAQVINDLYRILNVTGFPRIDITVVEEVILNNAPAAIKAGTPQEQKAWLTGELRGIASAFGGLRPDQAFIHMDSVQAKIINDKNPGVAVDISKVIEVLNGQNQAALKTMATIIGRGESGVNTASVEARIFCMNADELNGPVAEQLSQILTFALATQGRKNYVDVQFRKVELRPKLELEANLTMKQARLLQALSLGVISDDEYHIEMHGRAKPAWAPELSGTGFMDKAAIGVDAGGVSPNDDPLGRSVASEGREMAESNSVKKSPK